MRYVQSTTLIDNYPDIAKFFEEAYNGSYFTIEGAGGDLNDWMNGLNDLLGKESIGQVETFYTFKGSDINKYYKLTGDNKYPNNLTFLSFPLDGLSTGKLAMFKLRMGARWFDDIVDNNARREGYDE